MLIEYIIFALDYIHNSANLDDLSLDLKAEFLCG